MLDGTTDKQDARLLADIEAAPDPFDGGCAADVAATPAPMDNIDRSHMIGRKRGVYDTVEWLRNNDCKKMADWIVLNVEAIEREIEAKTARGE